MIFALILTPVIVIICRRLWRFAEVIKQKSIENTDMLKGLNCGDYLADGLGAGLFRHAYSARFMVRIAPQASFFTHVALV
ncbi:hypothetical protein MJ585_10685 [Klebsiella pneumoniae]|nr:hypothetical protein MJ585_10685 [Klebsiella pneumoniae]